jgi:hypothetical protein
MGFRPLAGVCEWSIPPLQSIVHSAITLSPQENINKFSTLIYGPPQVVLFTIGLDEDLIDEKGIAAASVLSLQSSSV